ncbi:cyclin-dependent kinase 2-associated protein 2-like [Lycorma delicatula]|uniref:cyclin-dependent kinase 2-associated protein 2-like n=1 Tax=Lycorma delicatula TaxID=130591 RepID=UPI003F514BE7
MMEEDNVNGIEHSSGIILKTDVMSPGSNSNSSSSNNNSSNNNNNNSNSINNNNNNLNHKSVSPGVVGLQIPPGQTKYAQLLSVIEEMGKDIRPTYAGSKSSTERLKRGIVHARILVRECLMETERSAQQQ